MAAVESPGDTEKCQEAFDLFDRDHNSMLNNKEFVEVTKILISEEKITNPQNQKIDIFSNELFAKHDKNNDGVLTFDDFCKFIQSISATEQQGAAPPVMNQRVMDFYLKYTKREKDGTFQVDVQGLPREWKQLFKASGIKQKELKDPDTVVFLLDQIDKCMQEIKIDKSPA